MLARQAAAAVGVRTCWPWETAAMLPSAQRARRPRGEEGRRHRQLWRPPAYSLLSLLSLLVLMLLLCVTPVHGTVSRMHRSPRLAPTQGRRVAGQLNLGGSRCAAVSWGILVISTQEHGRLNHICNRLGPTKNRGRGM